MSQFAPPKTMLSAKNLTCVRGKRSLFSGLHFSLNEGQWLHVCGENGTGKTSLLRILAGLVKPVEGDIYWEELPIQKNREDFHRNLLFLGHHEAIKEELSALENLKLAAALDGGVLSDAAALEALWRFGLKGREDLPVYCLSAGQKRRVLLARLQTRKAKLWILDEPFTSLDVKAVAMLSALISQHIESGGMAILTSHQTIPIPNGRILQL